MAAGFLPQYQTLSMPSPAFDFSDRADSPGMSVSPATDSPRYSVSDESDFGTSFRQGAVTGDLRLSLPREVACVRHLVIWFWFLLTALCTEHLFC
jgi:hypothetical protein